MPSGWKDLVDAARREVPEIAVADLEARRRKGDHFVLLDVREDGERKGGHIPGAIHVSRGMVEFKVPQIVPELHTPIVAYDAGGNRSLLAARALLQLGYANVTSLSGGIGAWRAAGGKIVREHSWTAEQLERYSRHFMLKEVGKEGQGRLLDARVLCLGAGGLGSPIAYYLAAAGVGTLGIVDSDVVDISNLQRQILHTNDRVGMSKVESAGKTVNGLNPDVKVVPHPYRMNPENVLDVMKDYDVVVDGADNFDTRYMLNDAAFFLKKPIVHGSIYQFEGQATTLAPHLGGPCYRCLYPERPPAGFAPGCNEAGVLGVLPGLVGLLQATEAVKLILSIGEPLIGRLLVYDSLGMKFREFRNAKDPECALCGPRPTILELDKTPHAATACGLPPDRVQAPAAGPLGVAR